MARRRRGKRNRKKQTTGGFAFPTPLASILVMAAGLSLAYLWLHGRCEGMGKRVQSLENNLEQVHIRMLTEDSKWAEMKQVGNVKASLRRYQVVMQFPDEDHKIRIYRQRSTSPDLREGRMFAQNKGATMDD